MEPTQRLFKVGQDFELPEPVCGIGAKLSGMIVNLGQPIFSLPDAVLLQVQNEYTARAYDFFVYCLSWVI
ncbi:MAG: hypothetical protein RLZZ360_732 [Candidatus Parcubacteria bacterium]|jgi:hypothetical protein